MSKLFSFGDLIKAYKSGYSDGSGSIGSGIGGALSFLFVIAFLTFINVIIKFLAVHNLVEKSDWIALAKLLLLPVKAANYLAIQFLGFTPTLTSVFDQTVGIVFIYGLLYFAILLILKYLVYFLFESDYTIHKFIHRKVVGIDPLDYNKWTKKRKKDYLLPFAQIGVIGYKLWRVVFNTLLYYMITIGMIGALIGFLCLILSGMIYLK
ncbi:hypothetical protein [Peribacillus acanthi]|uniref:hypothetical protein n=1 Tax=Peribacillus acanthi TaxID=2171554 RepID=UPI000D3EC3C6|nr:hypothetical protein [Peribacillus acanthi]